jgi:hypothetical protein
MKPIPINKKKEDAQIEDLRFKNMTILTQKCFNNCLSVLLYQRYKTTINKLKLNHF